MAIIFTNLHFFHLIESSGKKSQCFQAYTIIRVTLTYPSHFNYCFIFCPLRETINTRYYSLYYNIKKNNKVIVEIIENFIFLLEVSLNFIFLS